MRKYNETENENVNRKCIVNLDMPEFFWQTRNYFLKISICSSPNVKQKQKQKGVGRQITLIYAHWKKRETNVIILFCSSKQLSTRL